jgi:hypothetical protein
MENETVRYGTDLKMKKWNVEYLKMKKEQSGK